MASTFTIEGIFESDIRETAKAWGVCYETGQLRSGGSFGYREQAWEWFPKSQCTLTCVNEDLVSNPPDGLERTREYTLEVPMWLARKNGYYKHSIFRR